MFFSVHSEEQHGPWSVLGRWEQLIASEVPHSQAPTPTSLAFHSRAVGFISTHLRLARQSEAHSECRPLLIPGSLPTKATGMTT